MDERFEPTIAAIPSDLAGKLEPAELYHQVLEHRWFISEAAGYDVGMTDTIASYVRDVLTPARHEQITLPPATLELQAITSGMARPDGSAGADHADGAWHDPDPDETGD
jgi:hypothetical protein